MISRNPKRGRPSPAAEPKSRRRPDRIQNAKSVVLSLAKGFRVLEVFDDQNRDLTLSEIASRAGLDAGTTYRLVKTLVALGYLHQAESAKRYHLALKVLDLGFHAIARMDPHDAARPILRSLVGEVSEAASIGTLQGPDVVYIDRVHAGLARLGVNIRIGSRVPAYSTAIGHAILAHLPKAERLRILNLSHRVRLTTRTPVTIPEIEKRIQLVGTRGYAVSDQETVPGLRALAAPILDPDGHPYASVSVAAPAVGSTLEDFVRKCSRPVLRAAADLSRLMRISGAAPASVP